MLLLLGLGGVAGWWLAPAIIRSAADFFHADLGDKDSYSSVISMLLGVASLVASTVIGLLQLRRDRQRDTPAAGHAWPEPPMARPSPARSRLRRMDDPRMDPLALRVHPAIEMAAGPLAAGPRGSDPPQARLWRRRRASELDAPHPDLPAFVSREAYPRLCGLLERARARGGFIVLVGDSCVGKTRLLYEAARATLPDFAVLAPALGDGGAVNAIADAPGRPEKLIVWLDELQRFLDGPYLTPDSTPVTPATIRALLDADPPAVIVGTLWPDYDAELRATDPGPTPNSNKPRYPGAADILNDPRLLDLALTAFSAAERRAAHELAPRDPRLTAALADRDFNVTQALTGARRLVRRYEQATEPQRAIVNAAADARRLGFQAPLTSDLLRTAARGYLTTVHPDDTWFAPALAELTSSGRPQDRSTAPLLPIPNTTRDKIAGYTVADFLMQRLTHERRSAAVPELAWTVLADSARPGDMSRLAESAHRRMLYGQAGPLYATLLESAAADGVSDNFAMGRLSQMLAGQGRLDEALELVRRMDHDEHPLLYLVWTAPDYASPAEVISFLYRHADPGDPATSLLLAQWLAEQEKPDEAIAVLQSIPPRDQDASTDDDEEVDYDRETRTMLVDLLVARDRRDDLRVRADSGDDYAARSLLELLTSQDRLDELRAWADGGNETAQAELATILVARNAVAELHERADRGDAFAAIGLSDTLTHQGQSDAAIDQLRTYVDRGASGAAWVLARLLGERGGPDDIDELRRRAGEGDEYAAHTVAFALEQRGDLDDAITVLSPHATDSPTVSWLTRLMTRQRRVAEAVELSRSYAERANDEYAWRHLADLLIRYDRPDEAIEVVALHIDRLNTDHTASWAAHGLTALSYEATGYGLAALGHEEVGRRILLLLSQAGNDTARKLLEGSDSEKHRRGDGTREPQQEHFLSDLMPDEFASLRLDGDTDPDRTTEAIATLRDRVDAGDTSAVRPLARLLCREDHIQEALDLLRTQADPTSAEEAAWIAELLVALGRPDEGLLELRRWLDASDRDLPILHQLWERYDKILFSQQRTDELRTRSDAGDWHASAFLVRLLAEQRDTDGLWAEVHAGTHGAPLHLIQTFEAHGDTATADRLRQHGLRPDGSLSTGS